MIFVGGIAGSNFGCIAKISNSVNWGYILSGFMTDYEVEWENKGEAGNFVGGITGLNQGTFTYNESIYSASVQGCSNKGSIVVHESNVGIIHKNDIIGADKTQNN